MIRLCYADWSKENRRSLIHYTVNSLLPRLNLSKDLVIAPNSDFMEDCLTLANREDGSRAYNALISFVKTNSFVECDLLDIEKIADQKLRQIILLEFDMMKTSILKCLVNKAKKTEIVGVSIEKSEYFQMLQMEICKYRDKGFSNDQILTMLSLKHSCPLEVIGECLDNFRFKQSRNTSIQKLEFVNQIDHYIKFE